MDGVFIDNFGFFPMRNRRDRSNPSLQRALHAKRYGVLPIRCICGCGLETGDEFLMDAVRQKSDLRVDRRSIFDRHRNCIFQQLDDDLPKEQPLPSSVIFDAYCSMPTALGVGLGAGNRGALRFEGYARVMWSGGYTAAWANANATAKSFLEYRCPSIIEVLDAIDLTIKTTQLSDAENGYEGARSSGGGLIFGICDKLPNWVDSAHPSAPVPLFLQGYRSGRLDGLHLVAPAAVVKAIRESVQIFKNPITPPYLFLAVINADSSIRRINIHPIFAQDGIIAFVDSDLERQLLARISRVKIPFYKPLVTMADYERLPESMQLIKLVRGAHWRYCPDVLIYREPCSMIVEARGFKVGTHPAYDALMECKRVHAKTFLAGNAVRYVECEPKRKKEDRISEIVLDAIPRGFFRQRLPRFITAPNLPKRSSS